MPFIVQDLIEDKVKNKEVAALLADTDDITSASNFESVWERLDSNRPSRLAIYYDGAITDNDEKLTELRTQTVRNLAELRSLLQEPLTQIIDNLKGPDEE